MFLGSREESLRVLALAGRERCVYSGNWSDNRCDCKYGGPNEDFRWRGGEQSGCPELRSLYRIVEMMTDDEWQEFGLRGQNVLGDEGAE